jgi:acylphosphatase
LPETGLHICVSGIVQGVGYRYYCREAAGMFGIRGYVMNLPDGDVELEAFGSREMLNKFLAEITRRDRGFSIFDIKVTDIPADSRYTSFIIRF